MKIAIVTNSSWSAYNFRLNLAKALVSEGHEVIFIMPFDNDYSKKLNEKFKCYDLFIHPNSLSPFKDLRTLFQIFQLYKKTKPDVIVTLQLS